MPYLHNVPSCIYGLTKLTNLDISDNNISSLPIEIGNLASLEVLNVDANFLTTYPDSISRLSQLYPNITNASGYLHFPHHLAR